MAVAGDITIVLSVNKAGWTQSLQDAQRQLDVLSGKSRTAGKAVRKFGQNTHGATAAAMMLEGNLNSLAWAIGPVVEKSKLLSSALKMAFPTIGAIAFTAVISQGILKLRSFMQTADQMPQKIKNDWGSLTLSADTANDALVVTNDKLQEQIALLEKKRPNALKTELDEARVAADKLVQSLYEANAKMASLLKADRVGALQSAASNEAPTASVAGSIKSINQKIATLGAEYHLALRNGDAADANRLLAQMRATEKYGISWASMMLHGRRGVTVLDTLSNPQGVPGGAGNDLMSFLGLGGLLDPRLKFNSIDFLSKASRRTLGFIPRQDAVKAVVVGAENKWADEIASYRDSNAIVSSQKELADLKDRQRAAHDHTDAAKKSQEAARKRREAYAKAQAAMVTGWKTDFDAARAARAMTLPQQAEWWTARAEMSSASPKAFAYALGQAQKVIAAANEKLASPTGWRNANLGPIHGRLSAPPSIPRNLSDHVTVIRQLQTAGWNTMQSVQKMASAVHATNNQLALYRISAAAARGEITQLDAASATAGIHQRQYNQAMRQFSFEIRSVENAPSTAMTPKERAATINRLELQRGRYQVSAMQVAQQDAMANGQWKPGSTMVAVHNALDEFVLAVRDSSGKIAEIVTGTVEGVNQTLSGAIMAHSYNAYEWRRNMANALGGEARRVGAQGLNLALSHAEGGLLSRFGFGHTGKRGESAARPLYVHEVGAAANASSVMTKLAGAGAKAGGVLGLVGSAFQGFFAGGGTVLPGLPAIVGERGPELFVPHTAGRIVPNNQLGGGDTHIHVDARGAHDPAAVEAAVHRGIAQAAPHIVGASVRAVHEHRSRIPTNRRL